jgi:hypothetical protein
MQTSYANNRPTYTLLITNDKKSIDDQQTQISPSTVTSEEHSTHNNKYATSHLYR